MRTQKLSKALATFLAVLLLFSFGTTVYADETSLVSGTQQNDILTGETGTESEPETSQADSGVKTGTPSPQPSTGAGDVAGTPAPTPPENTADATPAPSQEPANGTASPSPAATPAGDENGLESAAEASPSASPSVSPSASPSASPEAKAVANSLAEVYVSADGNDETGEGTKESPVATLSKAVELASDGATIYLMTDVVMNKSARVNNKSVTIDGQGHTASRGDVKQVQDNRRSTYNPALFEINTWQEGDNNSYTLTFRNITIDDCMTAQGSDYSQETDYAEGSNGNKVQDAMIATYTHHTIVLGSGTVLQNYGGMSAVRLTGGGKLIMESGSSIRDTSTVGRGHNTESSAKTGQAGAVWIQGGSLEMRNGSTIGSSDVTMNGRAVYIDGGSATINGTITNLSGSLSMWQGMSGIAIHVRAEAEAYLGPTGRIDGITGEHASYRGAVQTNGADSYFEAQQGSVITNVTSVPVLYSNYGTDLLNGTIENCTNDYIIGGFAQNTTIGETGVIRNCTAQKGDAQAIVYTSNASKVFMEGQVIDNDADYAFYIINQSGGGASLTMSEGALISGLNQRNTGVYVNASESSFTMNGGTITNFDTGVYCRGKERRDATFIMNGGTITGNRSQAVDFHALGESIVQLNGGSISGNGSNHQIRYKDGSAREASEHIQIAPDVLQENLSIQFANTALGGRLASPYATVTLDQDYAEISAGRARAEAVNKIKELLDADNPDSQYAGWSVAGSNALWIKPTESTLHYSITRPSQDTRTGLYVVYIPLNSDGTPVENTDLTMIPVNSDDVIDVTLENLTAGGSYAVMFVNNTTYTLRPDNTTIYTGGTDGNNVEYTDGFPEITLTNSLPTRISKLTINGVEQTYGYGNQADARAAIMELLETTYYDADGNKVANDQMAGEYEARLSWKDPNTTLLINDNAVELGSGILIIRYIDEIKETVDGQNTYPVASAPPSAPVEHATVLVDLGSTDFYTNNDKDRQLEDVSGVSILDDGLLLESEDDNRQALMEEKALELLGDAGEDEQGNALGYNFDFHYLDLVDTKNGNAWIAASKDVTVYLPYPADAPENAEFRVIHYKDLHREYGITGPDVETSIKNAELEEMTVIPDENGISFTVPSSGFSPFAIVWKVPQHAITINYLDLDTNEPIADPAVVKVNEGGDYDITEQTALEIAGYDQVRVEGKTTGQIGEDDITINVYYAKPRTVTIQYVDADTNKALRDEQVVTVPYGDAYDVTEQANLEIEGYTINKVEGAVTGNVLTENITVKVLYKVIKTVEPTKGPEPTSKPSEGPEPTSTPSETPKPTSTPSGDPKPTTEPVPTATPSAGAQPTEKPDGPATGDNSNPLLWFAVMTVSAAVVSGTLLYSKMRRTRKQSK